MAEKSKLTEAKTTTQEVGEVVTLMERVKAFIDKHGISGTFTTLLTVFIASVVGYFALNPGVIFEEYQRISTEKHNEAIKARIKADPQIRTYLLNLRTEIDADRAFILETHNGGSNLTNLPFLYVDLTYAEPKTDFGWMEGEYKNLRLSRYPWASYIYQIGYWYGPIDEIEDNDPELYYRLQKEGVSHIGMMMMFGEDYMPSGTLGVVYNEEENALTRAEVMKVLQKYTTIIAPLLVNSESY